MDLYYRSYGDEQKTMTSVVLLHGLFGSLANWHGIARGLEADCRVIVPDLRNHGRSPHADDVSYPALVADVVQLLDRLGLARVTLVGHSMGGKTAMQLALTHAARLERLVVADMAPVPYPNRFESVLDALARLPLGELTRRDDADVRLTAAIPEPGVRAYLLQNLVWTKDGGFAWRMNLAALTEHIDALMDFPQPPAQGRFPGPSLFLYGGDSDYVRAEYEPRIRALFPNAQMHAIVGAGHWLYADKPAAFVHALKRFLGFPPAS